MNEASVSAGTRPPEFGTVAEFEARVVVTYVSSCHVLRSILLFQGQKVRR